MFQSDRHFQLWDYRVSHRQLLIRSPQSPGISTNIDLVFWAVEMLSVPSSFKGLEMRKGDISDAARLSVSPSSDVSVFIIETDEQTFAIAAGGCKVFENELDIFESSIGFSAADEGRDLGNVLAHS